MPSPFGHALAGAAAGWAVAGGAAGAPGEARRRVRRQGLWFAVLGMLADADLLVGLHSGPTHGLGAAFIAALAAAAATRSGRLALAAGSAYATHTLLDWLGSDTSPPIGIMALWPASLAYYQSDLSLFHAISRRYWLPEFWRHNLRAVAREGAILLPVALAVLWVRWPRRDPG